MIYQLLNTLIISLFVYIKFRDQILLINKCSSWLYNPIPGPAVEQLQNCVCGVGTSYPRPLKIIQWAFLVITPSEYFSTPRYHNRLLFNSIIPFIHALYKSCEAWDHNDFYHSPILQPKKLLGTPFHSFRCFTDISTCGLHNYITVTL